MPAQADCDLLLEQSYPAFLQLLGTPRQAEGIEQFSRCALYWLKKYPPRCMRRSPIELQQDVIGDVILKLIKNDAAALRTYQDKGRPFFAWLWTITANHFQSAIKKDGRYEPLDEEDENGKPRHEPVAPPQNYGEETQADIVWSFARKLDPECLLGLIGRYIDGWEPKDLVFLLGRTGPKANAKVSDRLAYCLEVLRKMILRDGFRPEDFQF